MKFQSQVKLWSWCLIVRPIPPPTSTAFPEFLSTFQQQNFKFSKNKKSKCSLKKRNRILEPTAFQTQFIQEYPRILQIGLMCHSFVVVCSTAQIPSRCSTNFGSPGSGKCFRRRKFGALNGKISVMSPRTASIVAGLSSQYSVPSWCRHFFEK